MKNRFWGKRVLAVLATASLALPLLAGCTASESKDNEQRVLRVATLWGGRMTVISVSSLPMLLN